jgi:membrane protein DedA with SNARE-associated domain
MLYRLLGMAVWKLARLYVGRRFGSNASTKALAAGGAVAVGAAAAVVLLRRRETA